MRHYSGDFHGFWLGLRRGECGDRGAIIRYDWTDWTQPNEGWLVTYGFVWGNGLDEVWFVGQAVSTDFPNTWHWTGIGLDSLIIDLGMSQLTGVHGSASDDVWAVLNQSFCSICHFDGSQWTEQFLDHLEVELGSAWINRGWAKMTGARARGPTSLDGEDPRLRARTTLFSPDRIPTGPEVRTQAGGNGSTGLPRPAGDTMTDTVKNYIDGTWVPSSGTTTLPRVRCGGGLRRNGGGGCFFLGWRIPRRWSRR